MEFPPPDERTMFEISSVGQRERAYHCVMRCMNTQLQLLLISSIIVRYVLKVLDICVGVFFLVSSLSVLCIKPCWNSDGLVARTSNSFSLSS